jgi:hypothetical protein
VEEAQNPAAGAEVKSTESLEEHPNYYQRCQQIKNSYTMKV